MADITWPQLAALALPFVFAFILYGTIAIGYLVQVDLRAENERLRAALEGYACTCTSGECAEQAGYRDECGKPARAALEGKP